jgi:TRAP-type C4-dicarboxylate transport system permease small subunit
MVRQIETSMYVLASVLLFLTCLLTLFDVMGRNVFGQPVPGATELTELALVGITFLIYPRLAYAREHIVIDLFDWIVPTVFKRFQQVLAGLLGAVLFGAIGLRLITLAGRAMDYGDVTGYLKLPVYPALYFMSVMSLLTAAGFLLTVLTAFTASASSFEEPDVNHNSGAK